MGTNLHSHVNFITNHFQYSTLGFLITFHTSTSTTAHEESHDLACLPERLKSRGCDSVTYPQQTYYPQLVCISLFVLYLVSLSCLKRVSPIFSHCSLANRMTSSISVA